MQAYRTVLPFDRGRITGWGVDGHPQEASFAAGLHGLGAKRRGRTLLLGDMLDLS